MQQLTVRGFDDELSDRLRRLAHREGISLNEADLRLMRRGAGLPDGRPIGNSLDHLAGSWTEAEAAAFDQELEVLGTIDEELWA